MVLVFLQFDVKQTILRAQVKSNVVHFSLLCKGKTAKQDENHSTLHIRQHTWILYIHTLQCVKVCL